MNPVARFESFIERLMERLFTRATRSRLQPVEIGKRLMRSMEAEQSVGIEGVIVPNVYQVSLSSTDYAHFEPASASLCRSWEAELGRFARQRQFHMLSRIVVQLAASEKLPEGTIRVEARMQDVEAAPEQPSQHTSVLPTVPSTTSDPSRPNLILDSQSYGVLRSPTTIGRLPDNDIVVNDRRVSRHHAELTQQGNRWMLRDVGSTNGTTVNGKLVKEAVLKPGDIISLGGLEARWEQ